MPEPVHMEACTLPASMPANAVEVPPPLPVVDVPSTEPAVEPEEATPSPMGRRPAKKRNATQMAAAEPCPEP